MEVGSTSVVHGVCRLLDSRGSAIHALRRQLGALAGHAVGAAGFGGSHLSYRGASPEVASRWIRRRTSSRLALGSHCLHDAHIEGQPVIAPTSNQAMQRTAGRSAFPL